LSIEIEKPEWVDVFRYPKGHVLEKGRRGLYYDAIRAAGEVAWRYGCYAWTTPKGKIRYCGSTSRDYTNVEFKTNLHGRLHNYLQNHGGATNKRVFDNIRDALASDDVFLVHFSFRKLRLNDEVLLFEEFSNDRLLVKAVEELLIASYRRAGQCDWNMT
tara:strand:- start:333 stop:809 length:477 start_codon:yes stop_codon:yes gene_type:complete